MKQCPAAAIVLLAMAPTSLAAPPDQGSFPDASALRAVVERDHLGQFWGAALVTHDGKGVMAQGFGFANDALAPIDAATLFDIGSVSKQFTAGAILTLRDAGALSLDDTVGRFFPDAGGAADRITLRQLLGHTSGLNDQAALQRLDFPDRDRAVAIAMRSELAGVPGGTMAYANVGYVVLAAIVEVASGQPFEDYVREHVFKPAGMTHTGFIDGAGFDTSHFSVRERGTRFGRGERVALTDDGWGWGLRGTSGVLTSLEDLAAWDRALSSGAFLSPESTRAMFEPGPGGYAMGWFISRTPRGTRRAEHSGATRGYRAEIIRLLDEGVCIGVLTNERWDPTEVAAAIENALYPTEPERVEAHMDLAGVELDTWGALKAEGASVRVEPGAEALDVVFTVGTQPRVRIALNQAAARRLGAELGDLVSHAPPDTDQTKLMLFTRPYTLASDRSLDLPHGLTIRALAKYTASTPDGQRSVDPRPTIVVQDSAGRFWPIIVLLGRSDGERLAHDLLGQPE